MSKQASASVVIKGNSTAQSPSGTPFHWRNLEAPELPTPDAAAAAGDAFEQRVADEVTRRCEKPLQALRAALDGIEQAQLACRAAWEQRLIHLAAAMAQRIVRRQLRQFPDITLDLVREALQMASGSPQLRIELNPDDYAALGQQVTALAGDCSRGSVEVVASAVVSHGGCRVETRFGTIDQQIETQLARLEEELN